MQNRCGCSHKAWSRYGLRTHALAASAREDRSALLDQRHSHAPGAFREDEGFIMANKGFFIITDISEYTEYLTGSELDHANEILQSLFDAQL